MIIIKNLTVKNFMSVGNQTQGVNFNSENLTLVLGENLDQGGDDAGSRNGTGKTTIINALSYALYGQALTNIKRNNLINKTNNKGMIVTLCFEKNKQTYRIERGRSPNLLKFFINEQEQELIDESQGDSRRTQDFINDLLGMSHDMFKHIVALNTYTEPFLSMRQNDQRMIIEQLLGITILSEKAENLVVSANELPVAASKFLRSDVSSTTNEQLIISNDKGLRIGVTNTIDIAVSNGTGQMVNQTQGAPLDFKIKNDDGLQLSLIHISEPTRPY